MKRLALLAAVIAAVAVAAPGGAQSSGGRTLHLNAQTGRVSPVDLPPVAKKKSSPESVGDEVIFTDKLGGDASGTEHIVCVITKPGKNIGSSSFHCTGTAVLKDGTLELGGEIGLDDPTSTVAVTGGTGAYAGARGTLVVQQGQGDGSTQTVALQP